MWSTSMICLISYSVLLAKRLVMLPRRCNLRKGYLTMVLISDEIDIADSDSDELYESASLLKFEYFDDPGDLSRNF